MLKESEKRGPPPKPGEKLMNTNNWWVNKRINLPQRGNGNGEPQK